MHANQTPRRPDSAGVVTWVHFGDLHMATTAEHNYQDSTRS